jgi:CubicO group peptidase (beta-lactamase class C family)
MKVSSKPNRRHFELPPDLEGPLDGLFARGLKDGVFPGASLIVGRSGDLLLEKSWGRTHHEGGGPIGASTHFDLASLTKPLVTATLCLRAVGSGQLILDSSLSRLLPGPLLPISKADITLFHLLNHCSGLPPYKAFHRELILIPQSRRRETLLTWILQMPLDHRPGTHCAYSDLGFILIGLLMENVLEAPLDELMARLVLGPLQIEELLYRRLKISTDPTRCPQHQEPARGVAFAPTEDCPWRQRLLLGEVHDENAYCLNGVAGHAGLFGTARGIFQLLSHLLDVYRGVASDGLFDRETLQLFWKRAGLDPRGTWALGYDTPSPSGSSAGRHFLCASVGHLGFTGTSFWVDLEREIIVILLTNRVHPTRANDRIKSFRPLVHDLIMERLDAY